MANKAAVVSAPPKLSLVGSNERGALGTSLSGYMLGGMKQGGKEVGVYLGCLV